MIDLLRRRYEHRGDLRGRAGHEREVPPASARIINGARANGGRVVAVSTTATREVESAVKRAVRRRAPRRDRPGHHAGGPPRVVDGPVTGRHDPMASHLLLVEAVAGERLTQAA